MTATHCPALNMKLEYDDMIFYVLTTYLRLLAIWFTYLFRLLVTYPTSITPVARTRFTFMDHYYIPKCYRWNPKNYASPIPLPLRTLRTRWLIFFLYFQPSSHM